MTAKVIKEIADVDHDGIASYRKQQQQQQQLPLSTCWPTTSSGENAIDPEKNRKRQRMMSDNDDDDDGGGGGGVIVHAASSEIGSSCSRDSTGSSNGGIGDGGGGRRHNLNQGQQPVPCAISKAVVANKDSEADILRSAFGNPIARKTRHGRGGARGTMAQYDAVFDLESQWPNKLARRSRRRRGKGRYKPYRELTEEEQIAKDRKDELRIKRRQQKLFAQGKPMAPYNTTQFLLEDREMRIKRDSEGDSITGQQAAHSPGRDRHIIGVSGSDLGTTSETASISGDDDFDTAYDNISFERISGLSREEVAREVFTLERCNDSLSKRIGILEQDRDILIRLLQQNNISFQDALLNDRRRRQSDDSLLVEKV